MIAIQPKSRQILGVNQQAYQALKTSMSLNLRRQLLVAVCDNVVLQNQLATQLENDLAQASWLPPRDGAAASGGGSLALERLIFDSEDAHLPRQVAHWVRQTMLAGDSLPQVQVLGIEQMTRQPAIIQNHFLRSLEQVEALLPRLNTSLLVWLPWPWLRTIQSSSPTFWKWRNGVFEFVSDPTPALLEPNQRETNQRDSRPYSSAHQPIKNDHDGLAVAIDHLSAGNRAPAATYKTSSYSSEPRPNAAASQASENYSQEKYSQEEYPQVETHQVVALYGETDDSDTSDYDDQPKLETIATWDTVDVSATTIKTTRTLEVQSLETPVSETHRLETERLDQEEAERLEQEEEERLDQERWLEQEQWFAAQRYSQQYPVQRHLDKQHLVQQQLMAEEAAEIELLTTRTPDAPEEPSHVELQNEAESAPLPPSASTLAQRQNAADGYFEVGRQYRSRIESGERGLDIIEPAIAAYEGALRCLSGPHPDWGSGLNDLGTLYWLKAQQLEDQQQIIDCMNHSVQLYSKALTKVDTSESPDIACQLHSNLGAVFSMLATRQDPIAHFQQSASAYQKALLLCPLDVNPQEFATLQNSLGSVYWKLSHYEQDSAQLQVYLQQAIIAYQQALLGYSPQEKPLDYAAIQNNLGITYWSLAKHKDAITALEHAITAYHDALKYRTPESDAAACAITYNNLALSYWDLSKNEAVDGEHKLRYQRNAITAFESALQTASHVNALSKTDSAAIYHCIGDVHAQMLEDISSQTEVADSLQKSLHSYLQAIDEVSMDSSIFKTRLSAIVANVRSHRDRLGLASQQSAINQIPAHLISLVMQSV